VKQVSYKSQPYSFPGGLSSGNYLPLLLIEMRENHENIFQY